MSTGLNAQGQPQVISVHEYELKPNVDAARLERAFRAAESRGLFELPGLVDYHFVRGIRGDRKGKYAAIWVYENLEAWEQLWGPIDQPLSKENYPEKWLIWEDEILAPILSGDPDKIRYTSYLSLVTFPP